MESLGELLRNMPRNEVMKQAEERARELLADPLIYKFRTKHPELTDRHLKINMNRLYQYVTEHAHCTHCPGLERCPNDFQGHYTMLEVQEAGGNTFINDFKVSCKKFLAKQSQDAIRKRIRSFYVDDRALMEGYDIEEIYSSDLDRGRAVNELVNYLAATKKEGLQKSGLYLSGNLGTGKTFLMCYMLHELAKSGYTGAIVYMPDFSEDLKAMFGDPLKLKETVDLLKETDLLVFDDIGAENLNPWLRDHVMAVILNYRMNRKPTFFTSNYDLAALERHFSFTSKDGEEEFKGRRIMDRIRPFVEEIRVEGRNQRGVV